MSGYRGLYGGFCRIDVSDLPNHHNIWVEPEHGTQTFGKGLAVGRIYRYLSDPRQSYFNRIFERDDFAGRIVELV